MIDTEIFLLKLIVAEVAKAYDDNKTDNGKVKVSFQFTVPEMVALPGLQNRVDKCFAELMSEQNVEDQ